MAIETKKSTHETLVAVVSDQGVADCVKQYCDLHSIAEPKIQVRSDPMAEASAIVNGGASIVLVQAHEDDEETLVKIERLHNYVARGGSLIVILDDPTTHTVRRLFRQGVTDVLPTPVADNELIAALNTARSNFRTETASPGGGKIVSILKTAGGVGATTVAVNLARELNDIAAGSVALVDLDIQFGAVGIALDLKARMNVNDAIRAGDRLDGTLLKGVMTKHQSGFDVLPSAPGITPLSVVDEDFVASFCEQLKSSYDVILLELPMAWSRWFYAVMDQTDIIAPIVETSVRSADGARRIMQGLKDLAVKDPAFFAIANKVDRGPNTRERLKNLGSILGAAPEAIIREDEKTAMECADLGRCFKDVAPGVAATQDFANAARKLLDRIGVDMVLGAETAAQKKGLRLGKLPILGGRS